MDPIRILVDLALTDEMDPMRIDVVRIAERFAAHVRENPDLRLSGRVILALAVLLRMKSEILLRERLLEGIAEREGESEEMEIVPEIDSGDMEDLEVDLSEIDLPMPGRRPPTRFMPLDQLVEEIRSVIEEEEKKLRKRSKGRVKLSKYIERSLEILESSEESEDYFSELMMEFLDIVRDSGSPRKLVDVSEDGDWSDLVLSLALALHLANKRMVEIWQEDYPNGDIYIRAKA